MIMNLLNVMLQAGRKVVWRRRDKMLCSNPTPTFSLTSLSIYPPSYETPNTWDCITVVSNFPDTVPAHPFDILLHLAPEPVDLGSLLRP